MTVRTESRKQITSLGLTRGRSQEVTAVEAPNCVEFAGPMGIQRVSDRVMAAIQAAVEHAPRSAL